MERIKIFARKGVIGDCTTLLGMKDTTSFLIATDMQGLILIENGALLYSGDLPGNRRVLKGIIYIPPLKCYFLAVDKKLYRKGIDGKAPYLSISIYCGWKTGACFRYSNLNQRLIINKGQKNISILNLKTKKKETEMKMINVGDLIKDFRLFGKKENKVLSITGSGHQTLYCLFYGKRRGVINSYEIELQYTREEECSSIAVCNKTEQVLVEIKGGFLSSRMLIFKVSGDDLVKITSVDLLREVIKYKYSLECIGRVGNHTLWVGLSRNLNGFVQLYDFNAETGELKEMEDKRVCHREFLVDQLIPLNGKFYYIGRYGRFMSLTFDD